MITDAIVQACEMYRGLYDDKVVLDALDTMIEMLKDFEEDVWCSSSEKKCIAWLRGFQQTTSQSEQTPKAE